MPDDTSDKTARDTGHDLDKDQTTRPSQRKDHRPDDAVEHPATARQPLYDGTDSPAPASGDPTQ